MRIAGLAALARDVEGDFSPQLINRVLTDIEQTASNNELRQDLRSILDDDTVSAQDKMSRIADKVIAGDVPLVYITASVPVVNRDRERVTPREAVEDYLQMSIVDTAEAIQQELNRRGYDFDVFDYAGEASVNDEIYSHDRGLSVFDIGIDVVGDRYEEANPVPANYSWVNIVD